MTQAVNQVIGPLTTRPTALRMPHTRSFKNAPTHFAIVPGSPRRLLCILRCRWGGDEASTLLAAFLSLVRLSRPGCPG